MMTRKSGIIVGYYVSDLVVNVSALPKGESYKEWPSNIQDGIIEAMEKHDKLTGRTYEISQSWAADDGDGPYIRVVIRAPRFYDDPPPKPNEKVTLQ